MKLWICFVVWRKNVYELDQCHETVASEGFDENVGSMELNIHEAEVTSELVNALVMANIIDGGKHNQ